MDEARAVLRRIRRIEALQRERAGPRALLAELDRLLEEARAWLGVAGAGERTDPTPDGVRREIPNARKAMIPM